MVVAVALAACGRIGFDEADDAGGGEPPAPLVSCSMVDQLFVGHRSMCFLDPGGARWCVGENTDYDLGFGDTNNYLAPTHEPGDDNYRSLSLGYHQSSGIRAGELWQWGNTSTALYVVPTDVTSAATIVSISADAGAPCIEYSTGVNSCDPTNGTDWLMVESGDNMQCGVRTDHTLWCWGMSQSNDLGQLIADGTIVTNPAQVGTDTDWVSAAAGYQQGCALKLDGTVWCWGAPGQTGMLSDTHGIPAQVSADTDWKFIESQWNHTCAGKSDGNVYCWGADSYPGYITPGQAEDDVPTIVPGGPFDAWRTGGHGACAQANGVWQCFGWNGAGQLGVGTTSVYPGWVQFCS